MGICSVRCVRSSMAALLDIPAAAVIWSLSFCSPLEWGRCRVAHRELKVFDDAVLFEAAGISQAALLPAPALGDAARNGLINVVAGRLYYGEDPNAREKQHPKYTA